MLVGGREARTVCAIDFRDTPSPDHAARVIRAAHDLGITHFDTAPLYGAGSNEELLGPVLAPIRSEIFLASKCGVTVLNGQRTIDGRPETLKATCIRMDIGSILQSVEPLATDIIDVVGLKSFGGCDSFQNILRVCPR